MRDKLRAVFLHQGTDKDVVRLVYAGQKRLSPVQTRWNTRRRTKVRKRLRAKYFDPSRNINRVT